MSAKSTTNSKRNILTKENNSEISDRSDFIIDKNNENQSLEESMLKSKIRSLIKKSTTKTSKDNRKIVDENDPESLKFLEKEVVNTGKVIRPDPRSRETLQQVRSHEYKMNYTKQHEEKVKLKIRGMRDIIRTNLLEADVKKIVSEFKHHIIKVTKHEVILKSAKFGFEIYYNNADNRWWIVTLKFKEPFDPKQLNYITYWVGNSFVGYGFPTLAEVLEKGKEMLTRGRTGFVSWRDHLISYDEKNNRILSDNEPVALSFADYKKFVAWFSKNKIWIMVKKKGLRDSEDLMIEEREKRKRGESVNPLAGVQAKLLEPPRKATFITGYPVANPSYRGKESHKPENKLYQVGFTFHE